MRNEHDGNDLHGKIGTYGELRKALASSTPHEYSRDEIILTPENVVLLVNAFEGEVNNGGIDQFFFNSGGDYFSETLSALEIIGATKMADILRKACTRFPEANPPVNLYLRRKVMLDLVSRDAEGFNDLDEDFYKNEDDLCGLLDKYEKCFPR
jgi:Domain of unknown function (DUF4375)